MHRRPQPGRKRGGIGTKGVVKREKCTFGAGSGTVGVVAQRLPCRIFGLHQVKAYLAVEQRDGYFLPGQTLQCAIDLSEDYLLELAGKRKVGATRQFPLPT